MRARRVVDLGCGPGNSTELLIERYPQAEVIGLDSSPDMLRQARERLPACKFVKADHRDLDARRDTDLLFANAVFQWLPDHTAVLRRLLEALPAGGVLAVQMPDNTREPAHLFLREVAEAARGRTIPPCAPRRAAICRGRRIITICSGRTAPASTSGTASTIT